MTEDRDLDMEIEHMDDIEPEPEDADFDFGTDYDTMWAKEAEEEWRECAFCGCPLNEDEERAGVCTLCR